MFKRIIKLLIAIVFNAFERICLLFCNDRKKFETCVVLMYHDISIENYKQFVNQIEYLSRSATIVSTISIKEYERGKRNVALTFDDAYANTIELILPVLRRVEVPFTIFVPTAHLGKDAPWIKNLDKRTKVGPIISAEELKLLCKHEGVTIGSHGSNHLRLTEINNYEACAEMTESKIMLEYLTGREVSVYSYPFGAYNDMLVEMAKQIGYKFIFAADPIISNMKINEDVIGRIGVDPTDWQLEFKLKVLGAYRWHPYASCLKRHIKMRYLKMINNEEEKKQRNYDN